VTDFRKGNTVWSSLYEAPATGAFALDWLSLLAVVMQLPKNRYKKENLQNSRSLASALF
jgi:hypothetical protein